MSFRCWGVNWIVFIAPPHHPHGSDHQGVPPLSPSAIVGSSGPARLYYSKPCVKGWLAAHREFRLVPLPAYSPNLNLIERLWKFLRKKALNRWHKTFEAMQGAVAEVLDHLGEYRDELSTLMTERFAIVEMKDAVA